MSGPDLYVLTVGFLALKKTGFSEKKILPKKKKFFFAHKKLKKPPSKVAHNRPRPFLTQSSPDHCPQPRIDFSYYEISGPDICSLICGRNPNFVLVLHMKT